MDKLSTKIMLKPEVVRDTLASLKTSMTKDIAEFNYGSEEEHEVILSYLYKIGCLFLNADVEVSELTNDNAEVVEAEKRIKTNLLRLIDHCKSIVTVGEIMEQVNSIINYNSISSMVNSMISVSAQLKELRKCSPSTEYVVLVSGEDESISYIPITKDSLFRRTALELWSDIIKEGHRDEYE